MFQSSHLVLWFLSVFLPTGDAQKNNLSGPLLGLMSKGSAGEGAEENSGNPGEAKTQEENKAEEMWREEPTTGNLLSFGLGPCFENLGFSSRGRWISS